MSFGLIISIVISLFAVGAGLSLLWRFRDWRFGFLAGLALFASAGVLTFQVFLLVDPAAAWFTTLSAYQGAYPALVLSIMALSVMFFLERIIRERSAAEDSLKLAQISLHRADLPVFWFSSDGEIRYINEGACTWLGYARSELLSMSLQDIAPFYTASERAEFWSALTEHGSTGAEAYFQPKVGDLIPVDLTAIRVSTEDQRLACVFVRDISERKQAEAELRIAKNRAESASRAKSDFLMTMSHELRTPLNAVIGFAEVMQQETFGPLGSERYDAFAGDIIASGRHLLGIINAMLDLSKAEAGHLELNEDEVELGEILSRSLRMFREKAKKHGVELSLDEIPTTVLRADLRILQQIVVNLVSNAIKFTPPGGTVTVSARLDEHGGCRLSVEDTGCGISEADLTKVIEPFVQAGNTLTRQHEGTGLGLPLVNKFVELHGGTLELRSTLGRGTTVTARFPPERLVRPVIETPVTNAAR